jgi:hypothetical protein
VSTFLSRQNAVALAWRLAGGHVVKWKLSATLPLLAIGATLVLAPTARAGADCLLAWWRGKREGARQRRSVRLAADSLIALP